MPKTMLAFTATYHNPVTTARSSSRALAALRFHPLPRRLIMSSQNRNANSNAAPAVASDVTPPTPPAPPHSCPPIPPRKPRRLLCLKEVIYRTSIKRATIYRLLAEVRETGVPLFPLPVQVTVGRIGWHEHEIEEWIVNRPRAKISDVLDGSKLDE